VVACPRGAAFVTAYIQTAIRGRQGFPHRFPPSRLRDAQRFSSPGAAAPQMIKVRMRDEGHCRRTIPGIVLSSPSTVLVRTSAAARPPVPSPDKRRRHLSSSRRARRFDTVE
jgi:hypothetical protein